METVPPALIVTAPCSTPWEPPKVSVPPLTVVPPVKVFAPESVRTPVPVLTRASSPINAPLKVEEPACATVKVTAPPLAALVTVPAPSSPAMVWWLPLRSKIAPASTVTRLVVGKRSRPPAPVMAVARTSNSA